MTVPMVKGWCPGALRPMASGDGLVVRLRLTAGRLPAHLAATVAELAERHGNGRVDLTQRGNLQLRGVSDATLPALHAELAAHHLLDADAATEARRNLVVSPLACDTTLALARRLEAALATADLAGLPAKFAFLLDDGTWPRPAGIGFDVGFVRRDGGWQVDLPIPGGSLAVAAVAPDQVPVIATRLAVAFLALRGPARRMADLAADPTRAAKLAAAAGLDALPTRHPAPAVPEVIGETSPSGVVLGVGVAFGQMTAPQLRDLATVAARHGAGDLRLTPFRAILLPGLSDPATARAALAAAGFITDATDPRRAVVACTGAPACSAAHQPTRAIADLLAPIAAGLAGDGVRLHVSGCAKGCARPQATAATLVGTARGYDLVLDGTARDRPMSADLDPATLAEALAELGRP